MRAYQLGHGLLLGDAVSQHTLEIDRRLRAWGLESSIFARHVAPACRALAQTDDHFPSVLNEPDSLLIYHYSIYDPNYRLFQAFKGRRILVYHNITPSGFFRGWDRDLEAQCDAGHSVLPGLRDCDLALGVSDFNRRELIEAGFDAARTGVLPIFLAQDRFDALSTNRKLLDQLRKPDTANFLAVGRVVPNKALEDTIRIFAVYRRAINPNSRLYIVGSRYVQSYNAALDALVADLGLGAAVTFTGLVSNADLKTYYQATDLYLHASHHEGFCVPLLEAMHFGVPILARKAAAVPETLGDAGVLFSHLGYEEVAEMAHLLITDELLRARVIVRQAERLADFAPARVEARLREILHGLGVLPLQEAKPDD